MENNQEELFVGSAKENENGFTIELNLEKVNKAFERPDVQLALKKFNSKKGVETSIMLYATKLPDKDVSKWRTHSVKVNTKYRQKED